MPPKKKPEDLKKNGRKTRYKKEYDDLAYKFCLLGATDKKLGEFFDVSEQTINSWKQKHPSFLESLNRGKQVADAEVANAFYHRAIGYSHPEDKIFTYEGEVIVAPTTKHYPPDTGACKSWLVNRQPDIWRDNQNITLSGDEESPLRIVVERATDKDAGN